ncbi:MAG: chemotaxis protein CheV [Phycisphaeraceae bacterium]|nr:chemotaxis protein CheV [Phycisphaeraceae bacterium]
MNKITEQTGILLNAGTNELEVLVFTLGQSVCGVNVAKVREVVRWMPPTRTPGLHPSVEGMFKLRGEVIAMVDLCRHLGIDTTESSDEDRRIIVTEFNGRRTAFVVDSVEQIHRLSWTSIEPVPSFGGIEGVGERAMSACTGVLKLGERLVLMIDFESVADSIVFDEKLHKAEIAAPPPGLDRSKLRIVVAEDSGFMRGLLGQVLERAGFGKVEAFVDGQAAWDRLEASEPGEIDLLLADIEMPRVDGLHLTSRIRQSHKLSSLPVVLFSSLVTEDNRKKGEQVGANAQIAKPELARVVSVIDDIMHKRAAA